MDRAPGLSVRLKLTLSYAGFLMLAGAVLLTVGYFSLSRGVHPGVIFMVRSHGDLLLAFAPTAAIGVRPAKVPCSSPSTGMLKSASSSAWSRSPASRNASCICRICPAKTVLEGSSGQWLRTVS